MTEQKVQKNSKGFQDNLYRYGVFGAGIGSVGGTAIAKLGSRGRIEMSWLVVLISMGASVGLLSGLGLGIVSGMFNVASNTNRAEQGVKPPGPQ